jgi:asparagine synthase (glutamine-hydrolysing)
MQYSLEARSPFLDQVLWEFAASLPVGLRLRGGRSKAILREIARRRLGAAIAYRHKKGFGVPVQRWMTGRWRAQVEAAFRNSSVTQDGWIDGSSARAHFKAAVRKGWAPQQLWHAYVLHCWFNHQKSQSLAKTGNQVARVNA